LVSLLLPQTSIDSGRSYQTGRWTFESEDQPEMGGLAQDIRYALRQLRKSRGFTVVAVAILALGIGANTAIFSAVYDVLLRPLPFKDADRLVFVGKQNPSRGWTNNPISPPEILAWRDQSGAFEDLAAFSGHSCVLAGSQAAEEDPCETASSNLFSVLGIKPFRGRTFLSEEDKPEGARVVILSYGLWRRRFAGDETLMGHSIDISGTSYTVVGVMPSGFSRLYATPGYPLPELWTSGIALSPVHVWNDYFAVGRLKHRITLHQAEVRMNQVSTQLERENPDLVGWRAQPESLRTTLSGGMRPGLLVLMAAVTFVLLIACANLANLLLARNAARTNEFAVRRALGAGEGRLVRQLLTESVLVSVTGGIFGLLLGSLGCKGLAAFAPSSLLQSAPGLASGAADPRVLAFSLFTMLATGLLFGIAPAFQSAHMDVNTALKHEGRTASQGRRGRRLRRVLVISEIALAIVLLIGAGLMVRTLALLSRVNLGLNPANVLTVRIPFSGERYRNPQARVEFWHRVVSDVDSLPGVRAVSVSRGVQIDDWAGQFFVTAEQPNPAPGQIPDANYVIAGPDYFRTLQIPLRRGRSFDEHDTGSNPQVVIINEELARLHWPGQNALGKQLRVGPPSAPWRSVVGIVGNILSQGADAGVHPELYIPYQQFPWLMDGPHNLLVRSAAGVNLQSLAHAVVDQIHYEDKGLAVADIATLDQLAAEPLEEQKIVMVLLVGFAGLAALLSALGIYSLLAYLVSRRTHEIGVRMALGARSVHVFCMVLNEGIRMTLAGVIFGLLAALALTRLMASLLFGVRPTDPMTFAAVVLLLMAIALLACFIPARRAANADPIVALRYE
jgi:putative ABC transport system permease protein